MVQPKLTPKLEFNHGCGPPPVSQVVSSLKGMSRSVPRRFTGTSTPESELCDFSKHGSFARELLLSLGMGSIT